jgi:hypothetical protein
MPLPIGVADSDLLLAVVANAGTTGPAAPTGWTSVYAASAGSGQCCSIFTAPYSPGLGLAFTNAASAAVAVCGAYYEAGRIISLDVAPVATTSTTNNTALPTGAPTTGLVAGDFEVLAYSHTAAPTITTTASGSTINLRAVNGTSCTAILGHNTTTSLGASTACTAFSHTLSASNARKTGVGILLKATVPATRQTGGIGVVVDVAPPQDKIRQTASVGLNVDVVVPLGVQYGQAAVSVDLVPVTSKRLGMLGIMVDYVYSAIPTTAARWSGSAFETGTSSPLVYWDGTAFAPSGTSIVVWEDDHFEEAP